MFWSGLDNGLGDGLATALGGMIPVSVKKTRLRKENPLNSQLECDNASANANANANANASANANANANATGVCEKNTPPERRTQSSIGTRSTNTHSYIYIYIYRYATT